MIFCDHLPLATKHNLIHISDTLVYAPTIKNHLQWNIIYSVME